MSTATNTATTEVPKITDLKSKSDETTTKVKITDKDTDVETTNGPYLITAVSTTYTNVPEMCALIQKSAIKMMYASKPNSNDPDPEAWAVYRATIQDCQAMLHRYAAYQKEQVFNKLPLQGDRCKKLEEIKRKWFDTLKNTKAEINADPPTKQPVKEKEPVHDKEPTLEKPVNRVAVESPCG